MKRIVFFIVFCLLIITAIYAKAGSSDNNALLIQAAENGNLTLARTALTNGANVNATSKGATALMIAAQNGYVDVMALPLIYPPIFLANVLLRVPEMAARHVWVCRRRYPRILT